MTEEMRRTWLPYCVKKIDDAIGGWIVLNRLYQPLGMPNEWTDYEKTSKSIRIKTITLQQQTMLYHGNKDCGGFQLNKQIFLYSDSCIPTSSDKNWGAYQQRLQILSRLKCFGNNR